MAASVDVFCCSSYVPATGLSLSDFKVNVWRTKISDKSMTQIVTDAPMALEVGGGYYRYTLSSYDSLTYTYTATVLYSGSTTLDWVVWVGDFESGGGLAPSSYEDAIKRYLADTTGTPVGLTADDYATAINSALSLFSAACPYKQKTTLSTVADSRDVDISTLTNLIEVEGVEYPTGEWPRSLVAFEVWSTTLTMLLNSAPSAVENIYVYWASKHATTTTIPVEYTELVVAGAMGYALQILTMQKRYAALDRMATALTEIGKMITGGATNLAAAVTAITTAQAEIAKMITGGVGELTDADTALDSAKTEIAKMVTGGVGELTDADTALDNVDKWIDTDAASAKAALAKIVTYLEGVSDPSAKKYLEDGDAYINAVNDGQDAAGHYAQFASGAHAIASGFSQEATQRMNMATTYVSEAIQRMNVKAMYAREALQYINEATGRLQVKGMYQREAAQYLNEATAHLNVLTTYAREARVYLDACNSLTVIADRYQKEANQRIAKYEVDLQRVKSNIPAMPRPVYHFSWT